MEVWQPLRRASVSFRYGFSEGAVGGLGFGGFGGVFGFCEIDQGKADGAAGCARQQ